jgi:CheY-like chemotaxis protein
MKKGHKKSVFLEVSDTGCGMDEKTKNEIFKPFYTTKQKGKGLGLLIVKEIVHGLQGNINVESEPGKGSTFTVMFPASDKPSQIPQHWDISLLGHKKGGTILIIEDEEDVREVSKTMLEELSFLVFAASSGTEGVELFRKNVHTIDIVLMDLTMRDMNGTTVLHELRNISNDIPVLISSGFNEEDALQSVPEEEITGFIHKPYQMKTLFEKIRMIMDQKQKNT